MRLGLTTGACAVAASKAALLSILEKKCIEDIVVELPIGIRVQVKIADCRLKDESRAEACVVKDAGDNAPYDITHNVKICAEVEYIPHNKYMVMIVVGGNGVGVKVKEDLPAVSDSVIECLDRNVSELVNRGVVKIELKVPEGSELWSRTMNKIVGVEGGISILGEKGIELPLSNPYSSPYLSHVDKLIEEYSKVSRRICLTLGGRSSKIATEVLKNVPIVEVGDHLGYAVDKCVDYGIDEIYVIGGIAKMIKVSAGLFMMHSAYIDARIEVAIGHIVKYLIRQNRRDILIEVLDDVHNCMSVIEVLEVLSRYVDVRDFARYIADVCRDRLRERCRRMKGRDVRFHVLVLLPNGELVRSC
ncbi:MAG: hypothetical protein GXO23_01555 [Crenarchaeota archaeon]|nr:hypothetical protein [Thermoproteota archaeon]